MVHKVVSYVDGWWGVVSINGDGKGACGWAGAMRMKNLGGI